MADTTSQQITDAVMDFLSKMNPNQNTQDHLLIIEMSSLTYNFLAGANASLILDPSQTMHAYRHFKSFRTKLGFPFPKPDGILSIPLDGKNWNIFVYLENKMKLLKIRMSIVQIVSQKTFNP